MNWCVMETECDFLWLHEFHFILAWFKTFMIIQVEITYSITFEGSISGDVSK